MADPTPSRFQRNAMYTKAGVIYGCPAAKEDVSLACFWYLDTDQGAEGFLSPCSTTVACSAADGCEALANGRCPLTRGRGEVLNELKIRVLEGERWLRLEDDGRIVETGEPREDGKAIWFGATTVVGEGSRA